jgi:hypothetical protein
MTTSPSEEEAALKVKANKARAEVVAETVRREPPYRAQSLSSDHSLRPPHAHALLSTTARIRPARSPPAA